MTKPIDINKQVQTTCGLKARIICTDRKGERRIIALIEDAYGIEDMCSFNLDGSGPRFTLINVPKRITGWVNWYRDHASIPHPTKEDADDHSLDGRIACTYVDFPEGEELE